jgi:hypothetical protein
LKHRRDVLACTFGVTDYIGVINDTGFGFLADDRSNARGSPAKRWKSGQSAALECRWRTEPQCLGSPTGLGRCLAGTGFRRDSGRKSEILERPGRRRRAARRTAPHGIDVLAELRGSASPCRRPSAHRSVEWVGRLRQAPTGLPSRTSRRRRRASGRCRPCSPAAAHRGRCRSRLRL